MTVHVLEIKFVTLRGAGAVGYGVDEDGREFAVALDPGLAGDIATAIDGGRRPIVAVERPSIRSQGRSVPSSRRWSPSFALGEQAMDHTRTDCRARSQSRPAAAGM